MSEYQIERYAAAAKDLRKSMATFPNGETFLDAELLLAITLATDANLALGKEGHTAAQTAEAMGRFVAQATDRLVAISALAPAK